MKVTTVVLIIIGIIIFVCGTSYLIDKKEFNKWTVESDEEIAWES